MTFLRNLRLKPFQCFLYNIRNVCEQCIVTKNSNLELNKKRNKRVPYDESTQETSEIEIREINETKDKRKTRGKHKQTLKGYMIL